MKVNDGDSLFCFILAYWSWSSKSSDLLPEVFRVLGMKDFLKFTQIFGGQEVRIPTSDQLLLSIKEAMAAYLVIEEGYTNHHAKTATDLTGNAGRYAFPRIADFKDYLLAQESLLE